MDCEQLAAEIVRGERRALARAITLIESTRPEHRDDAKALLSRLARTRRDSIRLGVSGAPGVGKSTFIEALGQHVLERGHRPAVLAVDPSSQVSGGSILGDKTRMPSLARDPRTFVRPSPSGGRFGGVARHTREVIVLCEAAGHDVTIVETVGVGQSETAVAAMVDMFVLLLLPGSGDELQGVKRGIMELADLVLVNKADGELQPLAAETASEYAAAMRMLQPRSEIWRVPVETCSATTGAGIDSAWAEVERFHRTLTESGEMQARREHQATQWLWSEIDENLKDALRNDARARDMLARLEVSVRIGELAPPDAAARIVDAFLHRDPPDAK